MCPNGASASFEVGGCVVALRQSTGTQGCRANCGGSKRVSIVKNRCFETSLTSLAQRPTMRFSTGWEHPSCTGAAPTSSRLFVTNCIFFSSVSSAVLTRSTPASCVLIIWPDPGSVILPSVYWILSAFATSYHARTRTHPTPPNSLPLYFLPSKTCAVDSWRFDSKLSLSVGQVGSITANETSGKWKIVGSCVMVVHSQEATFSNSAFSFIFLRTSVKKHLQDCCCFYCLVVHFPRIR